MRLPTPALKRGFTDTDERRRVVDGQVDIVLGTGTESIIGKLVNTAYMSPASCECQVPGRGPDRAEGVAPFRPGTGACAAILTGTIFDDSAGGELLFKFLQPGTAEGEFHCAVIARFHAVVAEEVNPGGLEKAYVDICRDDVGGGRAAADPEVAVRPAVDL